MPKYFVRIDATTFGDVEGGTLTSLPLILTNPWEHVSLLG